MTEGEAILANVQRRQAGLARPAAAREAPRCASRATTPTPSASCEDERGFAEPCDVDEPGLLLARLGPRTASTANALRDVFDRDDAWMSSESLCLRDEDGDHWLLGSVDALIHTDAGTSSRRCPSCGRSSRLPAVDLAVAYGLPVGDGAAEVAVGSVSLRPGAIAERERRLGRAGATRPRRAARRSCASSTRSR